MITKMKEKISALVLQEEGGKKVLNKKRTFITTIFIFFIGVGEQIVPYFFQEKYPRGSITKSDVPLVKGQTEEGSQSAAKENTQQNVRGISKNIPKPKLLPVAHRFKPILYRGKQVISPDANSQRIPSGANFVGKLLASIDTRSQQLVHVILPYGGSHKSGGGSFPPETILTGQFNYSGLGERVFMMFNRAVLPDGQEITIQAQALSSKDYRAGVIGDYHSNKGGQMASVLGLTMISGVSEVMVERQAVGQGYNVAPKATVKNGIYNGFSKVAETEANQQATELAQIPKYVTIDSGTDVIISLGESFGSNDQQE